MLERSAALGHHSGTRIHLQLLMSSDIRPAAMLQQGMVHLLNLLRWT